MPRVSPLGAGNEDGFCGAVVAICYAPVPMRLAAPLLAVVLGTALAAALSWPARPPAASDDAAYEELVVDLLHRYLQIDTSNPPGNEARAAAFLAEALEREGIEVEVDPFAPGRANLLATLKGSGARRALVLAHHMDVVPADAARWSLPPFSGASRAGALYGRGAQDMKAEGVLHVAAMIRARRERLPLARDLLLLATADEEAGFSGALRALDQRGWRERLSAAEYLITEGGENLVIGGRPAYFGVATAEKGALWLTLKTTGAPGHASQPLAESAPNRLIRALDRIRRHETPLKVLPTVERFLRAQARLVGGPRSGWYRDVRKALRDPAAARVLGGDREVGSLLRNTISITVVRTGYKTNVIPATAEAELDVRLLPGEEPERFLAELRRVIDDPAVTILRAAEYRVPNESSTDTELFRAVEAVMARHFPGVPVTTKMLSGATESVLFRPLGVACYGFTPLLTTAEEVATSHGEDERVGEATLRRSTRVFYDLVRQVAAGP